MNEDRIPSFPISWTTSGRSVLLVGGCGGELCRLRQALRFDWRGIRVNVPSDQPPLCRECLRDPRVDAVPELDEAAVRNADLVIESTADPQLAETLAGWCRRHRVPLNAMDKPAFCDFHYPALLLLPPLAVAVSSGGAAPAVSAALRRWLERHLGAGWATAARRLAECRSRLPAGQARMDLLKEVATNAKWLEYIEANDAEGLQRIIDDAVHRLRT
jgi:siroheme synthase-like protein